MYFLLAHFFSDFQIRFCDILFSLRISFFRRLHVYAWATALLISLCHIFKKFCEHFCHKLHLKKKKRSFRVWKFIPNTYMEMGSGKGDPSAFILPQYLYSLLPDLFLNCHKQRKSETNYKENLHIFFFLFLWILLQDSKTLTYKSLNFSNVIFLWFLRLLTKIGRNYQTG